MGLHFSRLSDKFLSSSISLTDLLQHVDANCKNTTLLIYIKKFTTIKYVYLRIAFCISLQQKYIVIPGMKDIQSLDQVHLFIISFH